MKGRRFDPGSGHGETRRVEWIPAVGFSFASLGERREVGLRVKMCVWLGVSRGLDLAFLNAD